MYNTLHRIALPFALAPLLLSGCADRQVDVKGKVTYNGKPLAKPDGQIVFVGPNGTQVVAPIGADGTYLAVKVPTGPNRVAVYYLNPAASTGKKGKPPKGSPPRLTSASPPPFLTPLKYASPETSNFEVKIEAGKIFDADLVGPKIR